MNPVLAKLNKNKSAGSDGILLHMSTTSDDLGIAKFTHILNEIYNSGDTLEVLSRPIFITLPKKSGVSERKLQEKKHTLRTE